MYLRLGSKAVARGVTAVLIACSLASCGREGRAVTVSWSITPTPPMVAGETLVGLRLRDAGGNPDLHGNFGERPAHCRDEER